MVSHDLESIVQEQETLRRRIRNGLERSFHWCRADSLYVAARKVRGAMILMYHSVPDAELEDRIDPRFSVPQDVFAVQMWYLARHRRVIAMSELVDCLENGTSPPPRSVVITFDDGYLDNLRVAAPILAEHGLSAIVYLATGLVERQETPWVDRLYVMFRHRTCHELQLPEVDGAAHLTLTQPGEIGRAYERLGGVLVDAGSGDREDVLAEVERQLQPSVPAPELTMNWDDVRRLRDEYPKIEIGAHTRNHFDLTRLEERELVGQLAGSVDDLERELGRAPEHFSYPYGRMNDRVREAVRACRFRSAVVTEPAMLVGGRFDRWALSRLSAPHSKSLFGFRTSGAYPGLLQLLWKRAL